MADQNQDVSALCYLALHPTELFDCFVNKNVYLCFKEVLGSSNTHFFNVDLS